MSQNVHNSDMAEIPIPWCLVNARVSSESSQTKPCQKLVDRPSLWLSSRARVAYVETRSGAHYTSYSVKPLFLNRFRTRSWLGWRLPEYGTCLVSRLAVELEDVHHEAKIPEDITTLI